MNVHDSCSFRFKTDIIPDFARLYEEKHDKVVRVLVRSLDFWIDSDDHVFELLCAHWKDCASYNSEYFGFLLDFLVKQTTR